MINFNQEKRKETKNWKDLKADRRVFLCYIFSNDIALE